MTVELEVTKQELISRLQTESVEVKFIKADGSERVMNCTQQITLIPEEFHPKGTKSLQTDSEGNPVESDNITVWDLDKQGWRMFNFFRLVSVK
jgi:hypothetical protein